MLRVIVILAVAGVVVWMLWRRLGSRRRASAGDLAAGDPAAGDSPSEDSAAALLEDHVRLWRRLPPPLQQRLLPRLEEFLQRIPFEGAHGFVVTPTMRTAIAAQACIVTLGHEDYPFDALHGITLHPDEFLVEESEEDEETGVVTEGYRALAGQAHGSDRIVLSWRDVEESQSRDDGYNVVIHEVTHFLEHSHPGGDPVAHAALAASHEALCDAVDRGEDTLLDPYGAEDLTEFLAVAAEFFFERPIELRDRHPTLYVVLRDSFRLDPASWGVSPASGDGIAAGKVSS
jgi:Mlc titration factor MtfA (ptsG expression regulator)